MPIARCARFDVPVQRTTNFSRWLPIALTTRTRWIRKMEFNIGELQGRSAVVVWSDFDGEHCGAFPRFLCARQVARLPLYNVGSPLDRLDG